MKKERVLIVGGGAAGLTAGAYCARENKNVLLLEKKDRTGGLLNSFKNNGFTFDTGPRAFVNSGILKPMLKNLDITWEFVQNTISIGIEDQMVRVQSMEDLGEYQRILYSLYPENRDDIKTISEKIAKLSEYTRVLYEFDNPNFGSFKGDIPFIIRKLIPWTFKFLHALYKFNQFSMPMEEYLGSLTDNQPLIDIILQHFFRKTPAYFALGYFHVYMDYFYPKGGTGVLGRLLEEKFIAEGGEIRLNTDIVEVLPSESRVIDAEGSSYPYDNLVWAADLKTLYRRLNPAGLDAETVAGMDSARDRILSSLGAESVFILYTTVNRPPSWFRDRGGEHMFYTPSRLGLGDTNRGELQRLIEAFDQTSRGEIEDWVDRFLRLNTFEVSIPVLRDPALAPEGQTGLMISCLFDYQLTQKVYQAGWYDEFKEIIQNRIIELFSQTIYPGLEEAILHKFSSTPLTINNMTGSSEGAITGWSFESDPPVVNTLKDIPKSVLTAVPGIYQAGQWAYSPAGVPIAMLTGWYAAEEIKKRKKK
ncbi:MAG: NAD(P)/FAD-dependent oxidoreductase [Anaerolineales bacterium]|nr:NAD(P)/FAD-dependent oxidoreductase [Anaerolineales bacterium]